MTGANIVAYELTLIELRTFGFYHRSFLFACLHMLCRAYKNPSWRLTFWLLLDDGAGLTRTTSSTQPSPFDFILKSLLRYTFWMTENIPQHCTYEFHKYFVYTSYNFSANYFSSKLLFGKMKKNIWLFRSQDLLLLKPFHKGMIWVVCESYSGLGITSLKFWKVGPTKSYIPPSKMNRPWLRTPCWQL